MTLYLIDYDQPGSFPPSTVTVTRRGLKVEDREAVSVVIEPAIPGLSSGPLPEAILVSRRATEVGVFLDDDPSRGLSVYVCRYPLGPVSSAPVQLTKKDLRIEIWGLLSDSPSDDIRERSLMQIT
jgi:hypothetical protein